MDLPSSPGSWSIRFDFMKQNRTERQLDHNSRASENSKGLEHSCFCETEEGYDVIQSLLLYVMGIVQKTDYLILQFFEEVEIMRNGKIRRFLQFAGKERRVGSIFVLHLPLLQDSIKL